MIDGTGNPEFSQEAKGARLIRRWYVEEDATTWRTELHPEILEAFATTDPVDLLQKLQTARATMDEWIADLCERLSPPEPRVEETTMSAEELHQLGAFPELAGYCTEQISGEEF